MSNPEHRRLSIVEDLRLRCADRLGDLATTRWRWAGIGLLMSMVVAAAALALPSLGADQGIGDTALPRASTTVTPVSGSNSEVVVHVAGAVNNPGVYRLPPQSRVVDAVEQAGGLAADVDRERVNLAAKLVDGQAVYLLRSGQSDAPIAASSSGGSAQQGPVDINVATEAELQELPGLGPATAKAIVDFRSKNGPFASVDDLGKVRGIGPSKLAELRDAARV